MLELREVYKHYHGEGEIVRAVDGVSLSVEPGELVALYGPSGSGKSTLLMIAGAILDPDRGRVYAHGRDITALSGRDTLLYRRREVGFIHQTFHLQPALSAADNAAVKLVADGMGPRAARRHVAGLFEELGIGNRATHRPSKLSGGERQRVAIARALANDPRIVLADEPTGNLDSHRGRQVLDLLRGLAHDRDLAVLLVTHDPEGAQVADRSLVLRDGQLEERLPGASETHVAVDVEVR